MKRSLGIAAAVAMIFAASANADVATYGWEDGGTILGSYGNLADPTNVTGSQLGSQGSSLPDYTCPGANSGSYYLHVAEDPHASTPQAYLAWVTGLTDGDVVEASFYGYDTSSGSPSLRIWGGYSTEYNINNYQGSPGGNSTYTDDSGWNQVSHSWTFDSDGGTRSGLVIQARLYSTPSTNDPDHTDFWIDDISVTFPSTATVHFAPEPATLGLLVIGGLALRRRR
jgi:hypothetical protein